MAQPGFWDHQEAARDTIAESNRIKAWVDPWNDLSASKVKELDALAELLARGESDAELQA
jgi:predicted ATPase